MIRDNILIYFLKLEIFLKNPEGSQILQEVHSLCVYETMAVILTISLNQLVPH